MQRVTEEAVKQRPPDMGLELIRHGQMPTADALDKTGLPCWSWQSICKAFGANPEELRGLLVPNMDIRANAD